MSHITRVSAGSLNLLLCVQNASLHLLGRWTWLLLSLLHLQHAKLPNWALGCPEQRAGLTEVMMRTKVLRGGVWNLQSRELQSQAVGTMKKRHRDMVASPLCCPEHRWHLAHATPMTTPTAIFSVLRAKTGLFRPVKSLTGLPQPVWVPEGQGLCMLNASSDSVAQLAHSSYLYNI